MKTIGRITSILAFIFWAVTDGTLASSAVDELVEQADGMITKHHNYPEALKRAIPLYRRAAAADPTDPAPLRRLAYACLELGELIENDPLRWFREGEDAARRALALNDRSAEAHFLLAANRGWMANTLPFWKVSPKTPAELETHLVRALRIEPKHSRALHMMGMLLHRTPGPLRLFLKGRKEQVEDYLARAVDADPASARLRISLAEFYFEVGDHGKAKKQVEIIIGLTDPKEPWLWGNKFRPDAALLLKKIADR